MMQSLFDGFDPALVSKIHAAYSEDRQSSGVARAQKRHSRHQVRRAKAESTLASILPARFERGESWHVISHGDIDALSYLQHAIAATHFDQVLLSTWCIAKEDIQQIEAWLDAGRIDQLTMCMGEIFPGSYGDEYELAQRLVSNFDARLIIAKNHSKVTLAANHSDDYFLSIESSANVNTNPRIEQTTITEDKELYNFYLDFFHGLSSIDKHSARKAS